MIQFQDRFIFLLSNLYFPNYLSVAQREAGQTWDRRLTDADSPASTAELLGKFCTVLSSNPEGFTNCWTTQPNCLHARCSRASTPPSPRINPSSSPQNSHQMPCQALAAFRSASPRTTLHNTLSLQTWIWPAPRGSSETCTEPPTSEPHSSEQLQLLFWMLNCSLMPSWLRGIKPTMVTGTAVIWQILLVFLQMAAEYQLGFDCFF